MYFKQNFTLSEVNLEHGLFLKLHSSKSWWKYLQSFQIWLRIVLQSHLANETIPESLNGK